MITIQYNNGALKTVKILRRNTPSMWDRTHTCSICRIKNHNTEYIYIYLWKQPAAIYIYIHSTYAIIVWNEYEYVYKIQSHFPVAKQLSKLYKFR